jgi:hypothetical protein
MGLGRVVHVRIEQLDPSYAGFAVRAVYAAVAVALSPANGVDDGGGVPGRRGGRGSVALMRS